MKTRFKFLMYGLMALSISIVSCEKEGLQGPIGPAGPMGEQGIAGQDGEAQGVPGPAGETGPAGTDGINGTNGQNGADGNANVRTFTYDLTSFSGDKHPQRISELTQEVFDNDVVLGYIKTSVSYYPIPSSNLRLSGDNIDVKVEITPGVYELEFNEAGTTRNRPLNRGTLTSLKVVIIKSSSVFAGKTTKIGVLSKLKSEGIDIRDYDQVMDYFGLEK